MGAAMPVMRGPAIKVAVLRWLGRKPIGSRSPSGGDVAAGYVGGGLRFVYEYQAFECNIQLAVEPTPTLPQNVKGLAR